MEEKKYAVIFTYSFDTDSTVTLFDSYEKARDYLKKTAQEEYRIQYEENGWETELYNSFDWEYATVTSYFSDRTDECTYILCHDVRKGKE